MINNLMQLNRSTYRKVRRESVLKASMDEIEALAAKLEPKLAKAILEALQAQKGAVSLDAIAGALEKGDIGKVVALLDIVDLDSVMAGVEHELQGLVWAAGAATAAQAGTVANLAGTVFRFNQLNPRLVEFLQQYSLKLIRQIDDSTKEGIRAALMDGMLAGQNPRDQARKVRQVIGLTDRQGKAVLNFRKELESMHLRSSAGGYNLGGKISRAPGGAQVYALDSEGAPKDGILERRLRDFRFDGQIQRAITSGKPLTEEQIDKMVDAYARKYLKHRSETIARTESMRATNIGVQDAWRQAIETGKVGEDLIRRKWIVGHDERLCEVCSAVPGMNPKVGVKFAEPFSTDKGPVMLPPLHPNCRCTVVIRQYEPAQLAKK